MNSRPPAQLDQFVWGRLARAWIAHLDLIAKGSGEIWSRGRRAATDAMLERLAIARGSITGTVIIDGRSYEVVVQTPWWSAAVWKPLIEGLRSQPERIAELRRHEITAAFESSIQQSNLSLFPSDFTGHCECSLVAVHLCLHMTTLLYLLAQEFDRQQALILRLNGMALPDLLQRLNAAPAEQQDEAATLTFEQFWTGKELPSEALPPNDEKLPPIGHLLQEGYLPPPEADDPPMHVDLMPWYEAASLFGQRQRWEDAGA
ncbi:MAG: hypothetical protein H0X24_00010 [Ktedonobacterales bacterium]|nr:hypothetical protein [Ktedonobacterales bacterium]